MAQNTRIGSILGRIGVLAVIVLLLATSTGRAAGGRFLRALRINRPDPVTAVSPTAPGANDRQMGSLVGGMLSSSPTVSQDGPDVPVADRAAAEAAAGFRPELLSSRPETPVLGVTSAHTVSLSTDLSHLRTIMEQAGRSSVPLPDALEGAKVTIQVGRGVRAQYGHCPVPDTTLQAQLQGPPPTTPENADCVIVSETPVALTQLPADVPVDDLVDVGLELSGMSPDQSRDFRGLLDRNAVLALTLPRFMRSYEPAEVRGVHGMLLVSGARRGPTYTLVWAQNGRVYTLSGYGSSGDAAALAASLG